MHCSRASFCQRPPLQSVISSWLQFCFSRENPLWGIYLGEPHSPQPVLLVCWMMSIKDGRMVWEPCPAMQTPPFSSFFLLQPLRTQSTDTGVCINNSQIFSCSIPRKKYSFLIFVSAHESWHYSEPDKRKQAKATCESGQKEMYVQKVDLTISFFYYLLNTLYCNLDIRTC